MPSSPGSPPGNDATGAVANDAPDGRLCAGRRGKDNAEKEDEHFLHSGEILTRPGAPLPEASALAPGQAETKFTHPRPVAKLLTHMRALTVAALAFLVVGGVVRAQQEATFRGGTSIVPILATVLDADGRLVPDLEKTDFTVLDNGKVQEVVFFQNDVQPFTVVVTMDFSFSMNNNLKLLKAAAEQFILRLLPDDRGAGRRLQRQDRFQRHVHQRSRRPDRGAG